MTYEALDNLMRVLADPRVLIGISVAIVVVFIARNCFTRLMVKKLIKERRYDDLLRLN